jgi:transcriptional regulator with XRE-family HTH domain
MRGSGFTARFPVRDTVAAKALARNVRRLRRARGLSQDELADVVGIQTAAISHIENRRGNPTMVTIELLAEALGVRFIDLFRSR